jgi:hypothetical protein
LPAGRIVTDWNQTWPKSSATELEKSAGTTLLAKWQFGVGQVTAIAYPADANRIESLANQIAAKPADPRFTVEWTSASNLHIKVTAIDHDQFMNGQPIKMEILDPQSGVIEHFTIPQTAPGQYELSIPSPRTSQLITLRNQTNVLKQFAIAGRYPAEFDRIGNNRDNLQALANRTGGAFISHGPVQPIQFHWPTRQFPLTSEFAFAGFAMISVGLIRNRRR